MTMFLGALALALAAPTAAPVAGSHAGHAQHQAPKSGEAPMDHSAMMAACKDPKASAEMKAHCAEMMKHHAPAEPAGTSAPHAQHDH